MVCLGFFMDPERGDDRIETETSTGSLDSPGHVLVREPLRHRRRLLESRKPDELRRVQVPRRKGVDHV